MMHRGHQPERYRAALFSADRIPVVAAASEEYALSVRVVASYRHLGTRQGMYADIDQELKARMGQARQAYEELRKPLFSGSKLPVGTKLRLFQSLILSRMMYGCAVWSDIPATLLRKLESCIVSYYRRLTNDGWWNAACSTTHELLAKHRLPTFRIFLAKTRLLYLRHLAMHRKPFHWELLLAEYSNGTGWLCEVWSDLKWMATVVQLPFDCDTQSPHWEDILASIGSCRSWKAWVTRAVNRHTLQEQIAHTTTKLHSDIVEELQNLHAAMYGE